MDPGSSDVASFLGIAPDDVSAAASPVGGVATAAVPVHTRASAKVFLARALNSFPTLIVVLLTTMYLLFANDIRLLAFGSSVDRVFEVLSSLCFFFFLLDLVARSWVDTEWRIVDVPETSPGEGSVLGRFLDATWRAACCGRRRKLRVRGYAFSFMFLLDVVAIVSILPEIQWIWGDLSVVSSNLSATRASRAARVGARLGRLVRVVRIVRLVRLYMMWWAASEVAHAHGPERTEVLRESRMGHHLNTSTTRTVIILVLLTLLLTPLFEWAPSELGPQLGATLIHDANLHRPPGWALTVASIENRYALQSGLLGADGFLAGDAKAPLLVKVLFSPATGVDPTLVLDRSDVYSGLRTGAWTEIVQFSFADVNSAGALVTTVVWFNMRPLQRLNSLLSIILTVVIVILLLGGALQFSASAQLLVLRPLERMLEFVESVAVNPTVEAASSSGDSEATFETQLLENVIKKIVSILRVGFGGAGMRMVGNHVSTRSRRQPRQSAIAVGSVAAASGSAHERRSSRPRFSLRWTADASNRFVVVVEPPTPTPVPRLPWRRQFVPGRHFTAGDAFSGHGLFDPFRSGRKVRAILVRVVIPHFQAACDLLGERVFVYNNLIAKIVHDTVLAWDGAVLANSGGEFACAWVIDDAWDALFTEIRACAFVRSGVVGGGDGGEAAGPTSPSPATPVLSSALDDKQLRSGPLSPRPPPPPLAAMRAASLGAAIIGADAPGDVDGDATPSSRSDLVHALVRHASQADFSGPDSPRSSPRRRADGGSALLRRRSTARNSGFQQSPERPGASSGRGEAAGSAPGSFVAGAPAASAAPGGDTLEAFSSSVIMVNWPSARSAGSESPRDAPSLLVDAEAEGDEEARARARTVAILAEKAREVADRALAAAASMVAAVRRSKDLARSPELAELRASSRLRGLRPDLSVGMHAVWCVRGSL